DCRVCILTGWTSACRGAGIGFGVAVLLALAGLIRRVRRGAALHPAEGAAIAVALGAIAIACIYVLAPASAQGLRSHPYAGLVAANSRYIAPAFILAAAVAALGTATLRRTRIVAELVALGAVIEGLAAHWKWA